MSDLVIETRAPSSGAHDWAGQRLFAVLVAIAASATGQGGPHHPEQDPIGSALGPTTAQHDLAGAGAQASGKGV